MLKNNLPIPYHGFKNAHKFPTVICITGINKNQTDQIKRVRGFAKGSLEPEKPRYTRAIRNKKENKLVIILIFSKLRSEIILKKLKFLI